MSYIGPFYHFGILKVSFITYFYLENTLWTVWQKLKKICGNFFFKQTLGMVRFWPSIGPILEPSFDPLLYSLWPSLVCFWSPFVPPWGMYGMNNIVWTSKDTNRKIGTTLFIDYCVWILVPSKTCTAPFVHGSHLLRLHLCLLCYCWNNVWNHRCIRNRFFLSFN